MGFKVAFYKGTSRKPIAALTQWAIRFWTLGKYCHVEFIDDHGFREARRWTWYGATSFSPGRTCARPIEFKSAHWDVFDLPHDVDYTPAIKWGKQNLGRHYDWLGIFLSQFVQMGIHSYDKFFCSEFSMEQLQKTRLLRGDTTPANKYSPNSMFRKLKKMGALKKWQK